MKDEVIKIQKKEHGAHEDDTFNICKTLNNKKKLDELNLQLTESKKEIKFFQKT